MENHKFHKTLVQFRSGQICKGRRNTGDETQEITAGDEHFGDVWNSYEKNNCLVDLGFFEARWEVLEDEGATNHQRSVWWIMIV